MSLSSYVNSLPRSAYPLADIHLSFLGGNRAGAADDTSYCTAVLEQGAARHCHGSAKSVAEHWVDMVMRLGHSVVTLHAPVHSYTSKRLARHSVNKVTLISFILSNFAPSERNYSHNQWPRQAPATEPRVLTCTRRILQRIQPPLVAHNSPYKRGPRAENSINMKKRMKSRMKSRMRSAIIKRKRLQLRLRKSLTN